MLVEPVRGIISVTSCCPFARTHKLQELQSRYKPLSDVGEAQTLWHTLYELTGKERGKGRPSVRIKTLHVATGAVLRCWGAVRAALQDAKLKSARRIRVVRVETTDDPPVRLVGMIIPEEVVEEVKKRMGVTEKPMEIDADVEIIEQINHT